MVVLFLMIINSVKIYFIEQNIGFVETEILMTLRKGLHMEERFLLEINIILSQIYRTIKLKHKWETLQKWDFVW